MCWALDSVWVLCVGH